MISELDLRSLWQELDAYEKEIEKETSTLSDVWVKMAQLKERNEAETRAIIGQKEFTFVPAESEIIFNVGGQIFETTASILTKDPYSVLAAYCRVSENSPEPGVASGEDKGEDGAVEGEPARTKLFESEPSSGMFFIDRDWWLFRHILTFLRSNILPNEFETLKELYVEANYYRLESLQLAIENLPVESVVNMTPQIQKTYPGVSNAERPGAGEMGSRQQTGGNATVYASAPFVGSNH